MLMPFGKHKGTELHDLPSSYLEWLIENIKDLRQPLRDAIDEVLEARAKEGDDDDGVGVWG